MTLDAPTLAAIALVITAVTGLLTVVLGFFNLRVSKRVEKHTNGLVKIIGDAREEKGLAAGRAEKG